MQIIVFLLTIKNLCLWDVDEKELDEVVLKVNANVTVIIRFLVVVFDYEMLISNQRKDAWWYTYASPMW